MQYNKLAVELAIATWVCVSLTAGHAMTPTTEDTRDYDAKREAEDEVTNTTFSGGKRYEQDA